MATNTRRRDYRRIRIRDRTARMSLHPGLATDRMPVPDRYR